MSVSSFEIGSFVETFLNREKTDARRMVRLEMERVLGPLVDTLFDQLKGKFVDYWIAETGNFSEDSINGGDDESQESHMITTNAQLSVKSSSKASNLVHSNAHLNNVRQLEPEIIIIKDEMSEDEQVHNDHENNISSSIPSTSKNNSATPSMNQYQQFKLYDGEDVDEEDCDCDNCLNGDDDHCGGFNGVGMDFDDSNTSESQDVASMVHQQILEQSSALRKKTSPPEQPKLSRRSLLVGTSSPMQKRPRDEEGGKDGPPLFVTESVQCYQPNCTQNFSTKTQLEEHLLSRHDIRKYKCLFGDCPYSSDNSVIISEHVRNEHQNINEWHCLYCPPERPKYFPLMHNLGLHLRHYHQEGVFRCTYPDCGHVGNVRGLMYNHYKQQHQNTGFQCQFEGCGMSFTSRANLKSHQRLHLGVEPFRCKFPGCNYASVARNNTINHIRRMHLKTPLTKRERLQKGVVEQRDPRDFLQVMQELL